MPNNISPTFIVVLICSLFMAATSCILSHESEVVRIGFSQCTMDDVWRVQMVQEMRREAEIISDIDFQILLKDARNNTAQQEQDIRSLLESGIDVLIVSPNQGKPLQNIIDSVAGLGIPVILIDRQIQTDSSVYFIGASNVQIGQQAGELALSVLPDGGNVLIFSGLPGSTPAIQRNQGFLKAIQNEETISLKKVTCDWTEQTAFEKTLTLGDSMNYDLIFSHNDFMARGIVRALEQLGKAIPPIIGIDGLNAPGCGIDMVLDSSLAATLSYPTGGDVAIQTAYKILNEKELENNIWLNSVLITPENVQSIKLQRNELEEQFAKIDRQNKELTNKNKEIAIQRKRLRVLVLVFTVALLLLIFMYYLKRKKQGNKSRKAENKEGQAFAIPVNPQLKNDEKAFIERIEKLVKENLSNKDLSVQFIGEQIGMSHSTVYRKIKKTTGLTGIEFIKLIRLNRAAYLLKTSNLGVEEIAFQIGFNTASYFSTSFVKQFGISPAKYRTTK